MKESTLSLVLVLLVLLVLPAGFVLADDEEYFLEFDGDWDYVDLGSLDPQTSELTVSLWGYAKKGSLSETYRPLISWGNWNDDFTWYLRDDESKMYSLTVNGDNRRWAGSHDEVEGEWINWVIVIDDGSARVFENGEIIREEDYGVNSLSLANTLRIGVIRDDYYYWLNGMLDDVRIYDRALNESEINNLSENRYMELGDEVAWWPMNEIDGNTLLDKSENNNDGTIHGATWIRKSDSAIMITDWNDLDDVRDNLTATYALANDLDENTSGYDDVVGSDWESIQDFEGSFNGEGREIRDLDTSSDDATGLFSSIVNANISNVGLVNADIRGDEIAGGLVGTAENSSIDDCYISLSSVKGGKHIGGLVGETKKDSIVTASYAENTTVVGSDSKVGGLVGLSEDSSLIERSYVSGLDVEGDGTKTGGLLGYNNDVSTVVESYAKDTSVVG
ncbi:MAG: LamG domain-containing protein, partial [Candidatus Nanoarchaeia archaeon]